MAKEPKVISVVTIPLKTEIWQEDILNKRMELCRNVYNVVLGQMLKRLRKIESSEEYRAALEEIKRVYSIEDAKKKAKEKKSDSFKTAVDTKNTILRNANFSEFGIIKEVLGNATYFRENLSTTMSSLSIAKPMWVAFDKYFYGNGHMVHFKKKDSLNSIASDGKSGIRIVNQLGETVLHREDGESLWCLCGTRGNRVLKIPLMIDPQDTYLAEMLDRDIKVVRIVRKKVSGKYRFSVQLSVVGAPAIKYKQNGDLAHPINTDGKIGVYIDTKYLTISSKDGYRVIPLSDTKNDVLEEQVAEINRYLDTSRRISNPDNFNADGTIKKGRVVEGQRVGLKWSYSNGYKKALAKKANLQRIAAENRRIRSNVIANEILSMGANIMVNDYPFYTAAMRKKEDEYTESGRPLSKKKAGKTISNNAPAQIIQVIDTKLKSAGYPGVTKKKLSDIDRSIEDYRKFYANELYREIAN